MALWTMPRVSVYSCSCIIDVESISFLLLMSYTIKGKECGFVFCYSYLVADLSERSIVMLRVCF